MQIQNVVCSSQMIRANPILESTAQDQLHYFTALRSYIKNAGISGRKIVRSQLQIYKSVLANSGIKAEKNFKPDEKYRYLLLFDLIFITAYDVSSDKTLSAIRAVIADSGYESSVYPDLISYCSGDFGAWEKIKKTTAYKLFPEYLSLFRKNLEFAKGKKFRILITATMSAGKSTLINALCGKNVTLSQNLACTSQLHSVYSKPFEDGMVYEDDSELTLDAGAAELLNDNEKNKTGRITVGTYFRGELAGKAVVLNDTPGVNSSQNSEHKSITEKIIRGKKYDLLLYVLNATQLGTNDDEEHLRFVKNNIGSKPILFILNKIDEFDTEDDDALQIIERHRSYLSRIGFKDPMICPLSSRYAMLAKKGRYGDLSRLEERELDRVMMDFEDCNYVGYYGDSFKGISVSGSDDDTDVFLRNCGMEYVERIISKYISEKEKKNG